MLFNSGQFLIFFPIVVLVYFCIPQKIKNIWLLIASYYFYMCWNAKYALLLLTASLITYIGSICIEHIKNLNISNQKKFLYDELSSQKRQLMKENFIGGFPLETFARSRIYKK